MSKDEASYWRKDNSKRQLTSKYTFTSLPWPIREDWNRLEQLHPFVLELSYADGPAQHKDTWRKSMRLIRNVPGVERQIPVHEKISMLHESECIALPPHTTLISVVIPSTRYLDRIDPHRAMSIDDLREHIRPGRHLFEDMLVNPIQFESDHPDMTIDEMVELYKSFYLVKPIDRACSAVVIALRFGTQGPGFEPGLFHKAWYMPLHGC
jgi:hypothetical protein